MMEDILQNTFLFEGLKVVHVTVVHFSRKPRVKFLDTKVNVSV